MSREVIVQRIEKSDLIDAKKELMIEIVQNKKEDDFDKKIDRLYRQFSKSSSFKKHAEKMVCRDDEKLKICNMMLVMSVTLTLFFLKAALFEGVGAIEKHHEARYKAMLKDVEEDAMFKKDTSTVWICLNCGHIHYGETAPLVCPVCNHPQAYFQELKDHYE